MDAYDYKYPFLGVLVTVVLYNAWQFNNRFYVSIMLFFVGVYVYHLYCVVHETHGHKKTPLEKYTVNKSDITDLVERFVDEYKGHILENMYKMPAKFKYILVRSTIWDSLLSLKFVGNFDRYAYAKLLGLLEHFFRFYYRALAERDDITLTIENMKQIHGTIKQMVGEYKLNVPLVSKKYMAFLKKTNHESLHDVIDAKFKHITNHLLDKINVVQALIDNKL